MSHHFSSPGISQTPGKAAPALPFGPPAAPTNRRNPFSATRLSEAGISQFDDIAKQEREGEDAFYRTQARQQSAAAQQQKLIQDANAEQEKQRQKALELDVTRASLQLAKAPETMTRTQREALEKKQLEEEAKVNRSAAATVAAAIRESPAFNERTDKSWLPFGMGKEPTPAAKELQGRAAAMDAPGYTPSASDLDQYRKINPTAFSELDSFKSTLESDKVASEQRTAAELAVARAKAIKDGLSPEEVDSLLGKPVASSAVEADTLDIDTRKASMARIESEVNSLATRESELTAEMQKGATSTRFDEIKQELATVSQQRTAKAAELTSQQKQVQDSAAALETKKKAQVEQSLSGQNPAILDTALKTAKVLADGSFETSQPEKIEALAKAGKKVFYSDGKQDAKPPTDAIRKEKKALTESKIKDITETAASLRSGSLKISENIQARVNRGDITKEQGDAEWDSEIDAYSKQNEAKTAELGQYLGDALDDFKAGAIDATTLNAIYHAAGQPETGVEAFKEHKADLDAEDAHVEALSKVMLGADGSGKDDPTFNGEAIALTAQIEALSEKVRAYEGYDETANIAGVSAGELSAQEADVEKASNELPALQKKLADMRSEQRSKLKTELVRRGVPEDKHAGLIARAELSTAAPRVGAGTAIEARGGGIKGAAGAVIEKLPYVGGFAEIARLAPYATLAAKLEKGETLSGEELDSLTEFVRYSGREGTTAMKIVEGVATILSFGVEMAGAPTGVGAGVTATRKAAAEAVKKGLTWATTKEGIKRLAQAKAETLLKGGVTGGTVAKAIVAKTLKAIPQTAKFVGGTGANKTLAAYVDDKATQGIGVTEQEGKIVAALDRTGSLTGEARHSQGRMMVDALFGQAKEFTTEKVGAAIPLLGKVLGRSAPKAAAAWQGLTAGAKAKISGLAMVRALQKLNPAKQTGDIGRFLRAAGEQGLGMEILEERIGDVADAAYGWFQDGKFDLKLPTAENFAVEVATMLIPMGAGAVQSVRAQNRIDKAITDSDAESSARIANIFGDPDATAADMAARAPALGVTPADITNARNLIGPIETTEAVRKSDQRHLDLLVRASKAEDAGDMVKAYGLKQMALEESRSKADMAMSDVSSAVLINKQIGGWRDAAANLEQQAKASNLDPKDKKGLENDVKEMKADAHLASALVKIARGLEAELTKDETKSLKTPDGPAYEKGIISQGAIDRAAKIAPSITNFVKREQDVKRALVAKTTEATNLQNGRTNDLRSGEDEGVQEDVEISDSPDSAGGNPSGANNVGARAQSVPGNNVPLVQANQLDGGFNGTQQTAGDARTVGDAIRVQGMEERQGQGEDSGEIEADGGMAGSSREQKGAAGNSTSAPQKASQDSSSLISDSAGLVSPTQAGNVSPQVGGSSAAAASPSPSAAPAATAPAQPAATGATQTPANAPTGTTGGKFWRVTGSDDTVVDIPRDMASSAADAKRIAVGKSTDPRYRLPGLERPTEVQEIDKSEPTSVKLDDDRSNARPVSGFQSVSTPTGTSDEGPFPKMDDAKKGGEISDGDMVTQEREVQPGDLQKMQNRKAFIAEKLNEALKNVGAAFTGITFNKSGKRGAVEPESESVNFDLDAIDLQTLEITDPAALQLEIEKVVEEEVHHVETVKLLKRRAKKLGKKHDDLAAESWNDVTPELRKRVELLYNYGKSFPAGMPDSSKGYELYRFYTQMAKSGQITEGANFPESIKGLSKKAYNELVGFLRDLGTWMIEQLPKMPPAKRKQFKKDVAAVVKAVKALENYAKKSKPAKGAPDGGLVSGSGASTGTTDAGASPPSSAAPADKAQTTIKASPVDKAAHEAATSPQNDLAPPTKDQEVAGNYQKGHPTIAGMEISIENPAGSQRTGQDRDGKTWSVTMHSHYGYIKGTKGKDGDHIDIFVSTGTPKDYSGPVFVVNQKAADGSFDEHKVVMGPNVYSEETALAAYNMNYSPGWDRAGEVTRFDTVEAFKAWATEKRRIAPVTQETADKVADDTAPEPRERDLSLTKPTGITGNTLPYPVKLHHWTKDEFEAFLLKWKFPPNTITDRLAAHEQAVVEALYKDKWVPDEVLADYPEAKQDADMKKGADRAGIQMYRDDQVRSAEFSAKLESDADYKKRFSDAIREAREENPRSDDSKSTVSRGTFEVDGEPFWFRRIKGSEILVWKGKDGVGAARDPIARLSSLDFLPVTKVEVYSSKNKETPTAPTLPKSVLLKPGMVEVDVTGPVYGKDGKLRGYSVRLPNGRTQNAKLSQVEPLIGEPPQTVKTEQSNAAPEATAPAPKAPAALRNKLKNVKERARGIAGAVEDMRANSPDAARQMQREADALWAKADEIQAQIDAIENPEQAPEPITEDDFGLTAETEEQLKARLAREDQQRKLDERAKRPLTGSAGEFGTPDLLDTTAGDMALFSQPPTKHSQPDAADEALGASERPTSASDTEYLAAVEAGDMEAAQRMVDDAVKDTRYNVGPVWHAGDFNPSEDPELFSWSHFGTKQAAQSRVDGTGNDNATFTRAYLKGRFIQMPDLGTWGLLDIVRNLPANTLTRDEVEEVFDLVRSGSMGDDWSELARVLTEKGFDGIRYVNEVEDKGGTSYLMFLPSSAKAADPVTRDASGAVIPLSQRFNPESDSILYSAQRPTRLGIEDDVVADALDELDALPEADRERVNKIAGYDLITNEEQAAQAAAIKQEGTSQFYDETRDRENHKAWSKWANDTYNADPEGSIRKIVLEARNGFTGHSGQQAKLAMLVLEKLSRKAAFTGDPQMLRDVEAVTLAFDLRSTLAGREIAARWQPHATMEEQHRTTIAKAIFGPTGETRRKLDEAMSRASKNERIRELEAQVTKLLADLKARQAKPMKPAEKTTFVTDKKTLDKLRKDLERVKLAKTEAELLAEQNQTRLDEVREMFEESGFTMEEVMIDEAARLKLQSSPMVKKVLESFNPMERVAIRAIIEGKSDRAASVESKISRENIRKVEARFDEALNNELDAWIDRGFTPDDMDMPDFASFMDKKGKLFASIRPQPAGITMAQRQKLRQSWRNAIHPPARVRNNTARKRLKSKKGKGAGLRIRNPQHAITVMRVLQREDTSGFDRVYEYWINGILSGIGTHTANVAGNMANVMLEYGLQRWVEAGANMIIGDAKGATAGELITMSKWVAGAAVTAFKQAKEAWNYEVSSFDWDAMGTHPKLDSLSVDGKTGFIHRLAIAGTKGRIIRIPSRALLFMDEFTKYFVGTIEAAAQGHRIAKAEKLTGAAFDDRVNELVRIPGSPAWVLALEKAQEMTFQQDLPKMLADAQKLLNAKSKSKLGATVRFALKMIFPFIKTPYNVLAAGLRKSPLGSVRLAGKAVTGGYKGKGAELSHDLAEQVIAAFVMMLVSGMAEGDPDDDKKPILITGTRGRDDRSEANFLNRSKGGETTVLFYGKPVFHYGRFAPLAVTVATIVNSLREMKKIPNGKDKIAVASSIFGDFVNTARSQTFLAGFDGLVNFVNSLSRESEGTEVQKAVKFLMNGAIPNIVRQTTRNLDEQVRDSKNAPWYYHAVPYGDLAEPLYDLYGRPAMKGGTALSRLFVTEPARVESVAPADVLLGRWNQLNPVQKEGDGSSYFPSDLTKASFKFKDLSGKYQDMTPAEIREFRKRVGVEISTQSAGLSTVPIQENIDELKKIRGSAAEKVKKEMFGGGVRPVLKSAPSLSELLLGK